MATLKQLQARLKKLRAQAESLIADRAQSVLNDIRAMMERHGLTTDDIERHGKKTKRAAKPQVAYPAPAGRREAMTKLAKKGKLPAKYRNPKTGETWSGWARPPAWIANVKDRSKFLIDAESAPKAAKPKLAARKATAKKAVAKKAAPAKKSAPAAKKKAATPAAKKTSATAKPAAKTAAKRSAPRKRATKAATVSAPEPASNTSTPTTTDEAST
ncbi:histone family protein nucleoid-structuring protein H-NS [Caballeronia pedi]|uniref:Histone family protein nucleoid-structuring protein H-NS n=1 Tax=Caballeronia pedi TaxID=1777141 RepID=A0A158A914_9BURK|nr:H-NS histone family protein [Caballeronia pedi]SAK54283.1 histone family protein nucleoid-structuring protein H-NS [Caballeronia pedi]